MVNILLWGTTIILLIISLVKSKQKTVLALKTAFKKFISILSLFITVLIAYALIVTFIPGEIIQKYIGSDSGFHGILLSLGLGSITVMPGFIAFPLCAALKADGIPYYIIAAFSLTLMNVGIATFPIERKFLGFSVALSRNILAFCVCIITVLIVKIAFGE